MAGYSEPVAGSPRRYKPKNLRKKATALRPRMPKKPAVKQVGGGVAAPVKGFKIPAKPGKRRKRSAPATY